MKGLCLLVALCFGVTIFGTAAHAGSKTAVVVVDVQADFTTAHKGNLAVSGTDQAFLERVAKATEELKRAGLPIYATQDWHPANHISFASNNKGKKPLDMITLSDGRKQVVWPDHCVQNSEGAKLLLDKSLFTGVVKKGADPKYDSYSGFQDDGGARTELDKLLKSKGIETIIVYGIAIDYCIKFTVLDGIEAGYKVIVIRDLSAEIAPETAKAGWKDVTAAGAVVWPGLDLAKLKEL